MFNDKLDADDLAGAEVLLSGSSEFARTMKRLCLYSATGIHGVVPKTEPRRAAFNATLLKYETLQRTYVRNHTGLRIYYNSVRTYA